MPASRITVNTPTTHGAIGFSTALPPSMTLGCGSWGGNVTSDNISPRHLVDVKRIAFETRPINQAAATTRPAVRPATSLDRNEIAALVDRFLAERHVHRVPPPATPPVSATTPEPKRTEPSPQPLPAINGASNGRVYDFVCEDDVKQAIAGREKIFINHKTIITPAARELGEERDVFARR
jgi:acetaldehyde dehydrogenase (acetylating)